MWIVRRCCAVAAKGTDGDQDERGRRNDGHRQDAAPGTIRGRPHPETRDRPPALTSNGAAGGPPKDESKKTQRCEQQRRAGAEERSGGVDATGKAASKQRDREKPKNDGRPKGPAEAGHPAGPAAAFAPGATAPRKAGHYVRLVGQRAGQEASLGNCGQAAKRPPDTGDRRDHPAEPTGNQRRRSNVERERGRAYCIDPPRSQARHQEPCIANSNQRPEKAARGGQHAALSKEETANRCRPEADGPKQPDFPRALFDAKFEKQRCEKKRRHHDEETEIDEVLAEIGRAARGGQPFGCTSRSASPDVIGIDRSAKAFGHEKPCPRDRFAGACRAD